MSSPEFYQEELLLLDKTIDTPTTITEGQVQNGDLTPFRHRVELVNTGNLRQNNGMLTLRIPPDGTFVRKEPILIDENAKDRFIIQVQLKQDKNKDGIFEVEGKLFRFTVGIPSIQDDENVGETLKVQLIPLEYRTKETLDAEHLVLRTPQGAFNRRVFAYNENKGSSEPALIPIISPPSIDLPDEVIRVDYREFAPKPTHELFRKIIDRLALPGALGGVFTDFFFDYEAFPTSTSNVIIKAEEEGKVDRGVIIDPLVVETSDTEKDKTINSDFIKFKNNVITEGSPVGGSLPMETTKFASSLQHANARDEYDNTRAYTIDPRSRVRINDIRLGQKGITRYFVAITDSAGINPIEVGGDLAWEEDFTITPEWNPEAEYQQGDTVTLTVLGRDIFFKAIEFIDKQENGPTVNGKWGNLGIDFLSGGDSVLLGGLPEGTGGRRNFFSYTPWTSNFEAMRVSTLFGIQDGATNLQFEGDGYQGLVPDYNYVRANFDRVEADNRFEQRSFKDVIRIETDSNNISGEERYLGARYLINGLGVGQFVGHTFQIAEWDSSAIQEDFPSGTPDRWTFSDNPVVKDTILDQATGHMFVFNDGSLSTGGSEDIGLPPTLGEWQKIWDIFDSPTAITGGTRGVQRRSKILDTLADAGKPSPLHICRDIRLTNGSSGIPAQAFELRFDFSPFQDPKNVNSRGAWWYMAFPFPKYASTVVNSPATLSPDNPRLGEVIGIGSLYRPPTLNTENLDLNHKAKSGWNRGLDSEDLGRIQLMTGKFRLSLFGTVLGTLVSGFADMPMKAWAVDIFDRVWFADFKLRRNGEYDFTQVSFGQQAQQQIHYNRIDELIRVFGYTLPSDFFLKQKEFTGIEFDWRFVKSMGIFWNAPYNTQGFYFAHQIFDYAIDYIGQFGMQALPFLLSPFDTGGNPNDVLINDARLAIDELRFEKQLYANSDDIAVVDARTTLTQLADEVDYLNLKQKAVGDRERAKFIKQAWFMKAHGDVRLRFGEKFLVRGPRVPTPTGEQELICSEVKHIIDNDGYMIEFTGTRKFVFG